MAPARKGYIKAFNVAVTEWKTVQSEKLLAEVDRILAVLAKTDVSVFSLKNPEMLPLLMNCQLLMSSLDHKASTTWTVVSLLTTISSRDRAVSLVLRDRTGMLAVCSKLLHSIPSTTQARTLKLLSLMKVVGEGVRIDRREAWLSSCISDIVQFLYSPDLSSPSLFLLCCLCQGNYIPTKMVISSLPSDTLTGLITSSMSSPADQLTAEILFYYIARYQLTRLVKSIVELLSSLTMCSIRLPPSEGRLQAYLPLVLDVFCSSYCGDDISMMSLAISFLSSLKADPDIKSLLSEQDCLHHLQQVLIIHDFSDGFCELSASLLFKFIKVLVTTYRYSRVSPSVKF